ncbi:MAG: hypothetical protein GY757_53135, partial [bacterium]|nr:hypothetical protein [bacterium]
LVYKIQKQFAVKMPLAEIHKTLTIQAQSQYIENSRKTAYQAINPTEKKEYYKLSSPQKRLYILQQMEIETTAYNISHTIPLAPITSGGSTIPELEKACKQLIQRHESLRTSFHMINTDTPEGAIPVQIIHDTLEFKIEHCNQNQTFFRPFDLTRAPLIRLGVIEPAGTGKATPGGERFLLVDMHHIITDATSQKILTKELFALNAGERLTPLKFQYKDFAEWQNSSKQKVEMKQQEEFWESRFFDELPELNLPTDYPRPEIQSFEGSRLSFMLNEEETGHLKERAKENDATLYMTILS